jgi:hypothetical protein
LHPAVSRPLQRRFLDIPDSPLSYWLRDRFFDLLAGRTLGDVADVGQGLATADDQRFVRFLWEVPPDEWTRPPRRRRWELFEKGGGYGKWFGHHFWAVDWEHSGARIKAYPNSAVRNEERYFQEAWTYSWIARGSLGVRRMTDAIIAGAASSGIYARTALPGLGALLNARLASAMVRAVSAKIQLPESYVCRIPVTEAIPEGLASLESIVVPLKRWLVEAELTEREFSGSLLGAPRCFAETYRTWTDQAEAVAALLHHLEAASEYQAFEAYGVRDHDLDAVLAETGFPAGWYVLLEGYHCVPQAPEGIEIGADLKHSLDRLPRRRLTDVERSDLLRRLATLYAAGRGARVEEEGGDGDHDDEDDDSATAAGGRIPVPAETFIEELAQKLEVHPISIYWLLRELRENDGLVCPSDLGRFVEDHVSLVVLRLLGHRWPREVQDGVPVHDWADPDGIVPISKTGGEPELLTRVRERLAADFGTDRAGAAEREFGEILGVPLGEWLAEGFFQRHVAQFRKRPVAWQLESRAPESGARRGRRGRQRRPPAFSCLVYYHRLNADLLPKLRTQYLGPLRTRLQTELGGLERVKDRNQEQEARRYELEAQLDELMVFDERLGKIVTEGFTCPELDRNASTEPLDEWTSRDGRAAPPTSVDGFLDQERCYDPLNHDGVRVNIAPLQRADVLAAPVLASRDVNGAIANRVEWRSTERTWCRATKLPRPGWWP